MWYAGIIVANMLLGTTLTMPMKSLASQEACQKFVSRTADMLISVPGIRERITNGNAMVVMKCIERDNFNSKTFRRLDVPPIMRPKETEL